MYEFTEDFAYPLLAMETNVPWKSVCSRPRNISKHQMSSASPPSFPSLCQLLFSACSQWLLRVICRKALNCIRVLPAKQSFSINIKERRVYSL